MIIQFVNSSLSITIVTICVGFDVIDGHVETVEFGDVVSIDNIAYDADAAGG